ncbi:RDD family protein [Halobacteriaceae archaeon SHR40]|uniref:RDD family protein n=1 Tax=Halovenus amylolytica TaxID=2500550 RepID=UPI000FE3AC6D
MTPQPAPLPRRTVAFLFDQFVVLCLGVLPALAAGVTFTELVAPGQVRTTVFLILCGIAFVYHLLFEWATDRTPGKRLFGLRVVTDDGASIGFRESFLRNALRAIDGLGYWGIAVAVILLRGDGKRLGDMAGHTLVVSADELSTTSG